VSNATKARRSQSKSNKMNDKTLPANNVPEKKVEDHHRKNKSYRSSFGILDLGCSKHMTGDRSQLKNFMKKFIGTVIFRNDHFGAIMGYGDYVIGDSVISRIYYVEGIGHNLFSVGQFCDSDLEVAFRKHTCFIRDLDGVDLIKDLTAYYESVGITHEKTVSRTPQQNAVVERQNRTLVEAAQTMLIFSKAPMFLWAEAIATSCYTQNRSLIHTLHNKTPCELVHDKKPDLSFLRVFGALCYPTNDSEDLRKLKAKADIGFFVGYAPNRKGLVPNPPSAAPYVPPTNKELKILFQPMFDDYFEPHTIDRPLATDALWCFYNSVLLKVEPKNFKFAVTEDCWFEAMQDEIHEFDRLQVWELVPPPDCAMIIALKWIYKVKLDEYGDVLKNKAQLVAKGYHQEEGLILRNPSPWLPDLKL
ncbi:retrovirus-related pol polyprotein from transposon TNT 1-94, partial [Tanacetum coccineum]